jgi:hypothetical protein
VKTALPLVATALVVGAIASGCGSPNRPAEWEYISPVIVEPNCASGSCHSPGTAAAGLDFSNPDVGYSSLTRLWVWIVDRTKEGTTGCGQRDGTTVCERQYRPLVTPYDPAQSRLVSMLRGRNAPRMPPDRPLDEADIELIERWILDGAKRHANDVAPPQDAGADDANDVSDTGGANDGNDASDASDASDADAATDSGTDAAGN